MFLLFMFILQLTYDIDDYTCLSQHLYPNLAGSLI